MLYLQARAYDRTLNVKRSAGRYRTANMKITVERKDMAETRGFSHCFNQQPDLHVSKVYVYVRSVDYRRMSGSLFIASRQHLELSREHLRHVRVRGWPVAADCCGGVRELATLRNSFCVLAC